MQITFVIILNFQITEALSGKQAPTQQNKFVKQTKNQNSDRANTKALTTQLFIGRRNNGRVGKRFSAAARSLPILRFVCAGLFGFWRVLGSAECSDADLYQDKHTPRCQIDQKNGARHNTELICKYFFVILPLGKLTIAAINDVIIKAVVPIGSCGNRIPLAY